MTFRRTNPLNLKIWSYFALYCSSMSTFTLCCCCLAAKSFLTLQCHAHGILQARILEWVAIPFSRVSSDPGIKPQSPALWADSLPSEPPRKPFQCLCCAVLCLVTQSCPTLWDPTDRSLPGSSVHGISQARTWEWVAFAFSRDY